MALAWEEWVRAVAARHHGSAVIVAQSSDGSMPGSLRTSGVMAHPGTGRLGLAFAARDTPRNLRKMLCVSAVCRAGTLWAAEGSISLPGLRGLRLDLDKNLLILARQICVAADSRNEDRETYDHVMARVQQRDCISSKRVYA